jgi:hypothetical protein
MVKIPDPECFKLPIPVTMLSNSNALLPLNSITPLFWIAVFEICPTTSLL